MQDRLQSVSRSLIPTNHFKIYHPVVFVFFMSSSSFAHAATNFQTCADKSISCHCSVILNPVFRHYVSDFWCDQSLTRFEVSVIIFIFIIVCWLLSYFVLDLGLAAVVLDLVSFLSKRKLLVLVERNLSHYLFSLKMSYMYYAEIGIS